MTWVGGELKWVVLWDEEWLYDRNDGLFECGCCTAACWLLCHPAVKKFSMLRFVQELSNLFFENLNLIAKNSIHFMCIKHGFNCNFELLI